MIDCWSFEPKSHSLSRKKESVFISSSHFLFTLCFTMTIFLFGDMYTRFRFLFRSKRSSFTRGFDYCMRDRFRRTRTTWIFLGGGGWSFKLHESWLNRREGRRPCCRIRRRHVRRRRLCCCGRWRIATCRLDETTVANRVSGGNFCPSSG